MGGRDMTLSGAAELPEAVKQAVTALCADFERRAGLISSKMLSRRTELEFRYLNFKIKEAAEEIAGERDACIFIEEIGAHIGYAKSKLYYMTERIYKEEKSRIVFNIAKKLHLSD